MVWREGFWCCKVKLQWPGRVLIDIIVRVSMAFAFKNPLVPKRWGNRFRTREMWNLAHLVWVIPGLFHHTTWGDVLVVSEIDSNIGKPF